MDIERKLEIAKQYICDNKLFKSLKILKYLIYFKMDNSLKEKIYFEIGKIYMMLGENKKSIRYLTRINKKNSIYNFAIELILNNYKILNLPNKQIDTIIKNRDFPITEQIIEEVVKNNSDNCNFVECFKFINYYKDKINNFDEILKYVYKSLSIHIQFLNENHKYKKVRELFKNINKYIPKTEKKLKNILLNEYELAQGKIYLKSYPRIINLVLTTRCNLKCIMCKENEHNGKYNLSDKEVDDLIKVMPYLEKLILRGGEVFLHKRILYILEQAKKYNVDVEIVTNGLLLTTTVMNLLLDVLTEITFSIDSVNKEIYEKIRVGSSFENLLKNIKLFNDLNKKRNYKVLTRLTMVVMRSNYKEIEDVIRFAGEHNFKEVCLLPIRGLQANTSELIFSHGFDNNIVKQLNKKKIYFKNVAKQYSIKLYNTLPRKQSDFNDSLICEDIMQQKNITVNEIKQVILKNKDNLLQKILPNNITEKKVITFNSLINKSLSLQGKFLKEILNLKINKNWRKNSMRYCHAPWKQIFLFRKVRIPTCLCEVLFAKLNSKNRIINIWNNKVMQYYRYKIINNKYKDLCSKDCSEHIKIL